MDIMEIEILEDGKISVKTSAISEKNHLDADQLLDMIEDALGGERETVQLKKHAHVHNKRHVHQ